MAFKHVRGEQELRKFLIANSASPIVGGPVKLTSGFVVAGAAADEADLGICIGVCDEQGKPVAGVEYGETYAAAADNQTVGKIYAIVDTSAESEWEVAADADLATTSLSNLPGTFFDYVAATNNIQESTASATTGTFISVFAGPVLAERKLIVKFHEMLGKLV